MLESRCEVTYMYDLFLIPCRHCLRPQIVTRIMSAGFRDGSGKLYKPHLVRFGRGQGQLVRPVSLDVLVEGVRALSAETVAKEMQRLSDVTRQRKENIANLRVRLHALRDSMVLPQRDPRIATKPALLPPCWEVRYHEESRAVIFCNRELGATAAPVFPTALVDQRDCTRGWRRAEDMPEFLRFASMITSELGKFDEEARHAQRLELMAGLHAFVARCRADHRSRAGARRGEEKKEQRRVEELLQTSFLDSAHIICTTLNSAAAASMEKTMGARVCIIDEAAQAVEPSTLIPMHLGRASRRGSRVVHCVLVGDPQQLSATVFAQKGWVNGSKASYSRSLFERLELGGHPVHLLDTQYRMHSTIATHASELFYGGALKTASELAGEARSKSFHSSGFAPFLFFDLEASSEQRRRGGGSGGGGGARKGSMSLRNVQEAKLVVELYKAIRATADEAGELPRTQDMPWAAVITPYSDQKKELERLFQSAGTGPFEDTT